MEGRYFYLGACSQGKIDAFHLVRTISPTHTEVRVFLVFVYIYLLPSKEPRNQGKAGANIPKFLNSLDQKFLLFLRFLRDN